MKYETPELTSLTPAINAIQEAKNMTVDQLDTPEYQEIGVGAYQDWE